MALSDLAGGISKGAARVFTVVELRRVGSGLEPTGVRFDWTNANFAAPRGAWQFGVQLRTMRKDLVGSEEPVEQVLGWNYTPYTVSGFWDDRHAGPGFALDTWRAFELMAKRGNPTRVGFEQVSMMGLILNAQFTYERADRIGYSFTVSPHNRVIGETVRKEADPRKRVTLDPKTSVARARVSLEALQTAQAVASAANGSRVRQLLGTTISTEIDDYIDTMATAINLAETTVETEILRAQDIANALARGVTTMSTVKTAAADLLSRIRTVVSTTDLATTRAVETLQFESWARGIGAQARALVVRSEDSRRDFALRAAPKPARLHRAREQESLYAISNLYYGTPHNWRAILKANRLSSIILEGGELLVIPEIA